MAKKNARKSLLGTLPKRLDEVVGRAEKLLNETWDQALDLLPSGPRKTVKEMTARVTKARADLRKRGRAALTRAGARRERLVTRIEKQAAQVVRPIVHRFDVATRSDLDALRKRLTQLERRVEHHGKERVAA